MGEPVRLATFLRERCARNKYGLRYLNPEQTLILIPWPVVPRDNEESPPGFQMFQEWAEFSHRRRGINESAEKETPTQQKHRFRNALARANGIVYHKEMGWEGVRVYELVDCRRSTPGSDVQSPSSQIAAEDLNDDCYITDAFSPQYTVPTNTPFPDFTSPASHHLQVRPNYYPNSYAPNGDHLTAGTSTSSSSMGVVQYDRMMPNGTQDDAELMELREILEESTTPVPMDGSQQIPAPTPLNMNGSATSAALSDGYFDVAGPINPPVMDKPLELTINVRFRQEDAPSIKVYNPIGCRVFFGKNVPDLSQLLEKEHLENLMKRFRKHKDDYFGNENFEQIQLPRPDQYMISPVQSDKTRAIFQNMERGLIIGVEHCNDSSQFGIPDVYVNRLCQTRIFPCRHSSGQPFKNPTQNEPLRRMEWAKVFDGKEFCEKIALAEQGGNAFENYPSPSFSFSLGQRPANSEERSLLLVCLTVTVQRAQQLVQSRLDSVAGSDVCISQITSTDEEARTLANQLTETLTLK